MAFLAVVPEIIESSEMLSGINSLGGVLGGYFGEGGIWGIGSRVATVAAIGEGVSLANDAVAWTSEKMDEKFDGASTKIGKYTGYTKGKEKFKEGI